MKRIKKLASLLLAMVMVLSMGLTVFATGATPPTDDTLVGNTQAGKGNFTITINNTTKGYVYTAYQIFSGDLSKAEAADGTETKTLSNIVWGSGVDAEKVAKEFPDQTATDVAATLNGEDFDAKAAQDFADKIAKCLSDTKKDSAPTITGEGENQAVTDYKITGLNAGYYLVMNSSVPATDGSYTRYMMEVVGDVTAKPKSDVPTVEKKVKNVNDSTGLTSGWQDRMDFDLNDPINYQIKGTLPANYADYKEYTYKFTDTMSKGLTLTQGSVKVYAVNGTDVDSADNRTEITLQAKISPVENQVFSVMIPDVKKLSGVEITSATQIVVEYTCTLNENAVTTSAGNENKVKLEYSNDPNHTGTGTTPEDVVVVFTFELNATKVTTVNGEEQPLSGAEFTLEKYSKTSESTEGTWEKVNENVTGTGEDANKFTFNKLATGIYRLTESKTPAGYNTIKPIYFMVEADYKVDSVTNQNVVDTLTIKGVSEDAENPDYTLPGSYTEIISGQNGSFSATVTSGKIATSVDNQKGSLLPSTGGIGTTIFYVVGGILVAAAGILLVTKKRMSVR